MFIIREGRYTVPGFGKLNTKDELSKEQLFDLYENRSFPFISVTEEAVPFLKKMKLSTKRLSSLLLQAKTVEEVNLLLEVSSKKPLPALAEIRVKALTPA